jgi:hypothetical protein
MNFFLLEIKNHVQMFPFFFTHVHRLLKNYIFGINKILLYYILVVHIYLFLGFNIFLLIPIVNIFLFSKINYYRKSIIKNKYTNL